VQGGDIMTQKIFAVMGATGHIGHVIVEDLLKRGHITFVL
jgi:putative NADH-flavin reductase